MRRLISVVGAAVVVAILSPNAALAKGPTSVTIEGPGIDGSIHLSGDPESGEPGSGTALGQLTDHAGLWVAFGAVEQAPSTQRPAGDLGPEYTLTWMMFQGDQEGAPIVQRLYPYAEAGAVTYTDAGQPYLGGPTVGGWHVGGEALRNALVELGLPEQPPMRRPTVPQAALAIAAACVIALAGVVGGRRARARRRLLDVPAHA